MESEFLHEGERLDDLQRDGLWLIQNPSWFCFGMDAVLLSAFARVNEGDRVMDLCTGNGVVPILLSARTKGRHFTGLELQEDIAEMAGRSVLYNRLSDRVRIDCGDVRDAVRTYGAAQFEVVTVNPPYLTETGGLINPADHKAVARHELKLTLQDVIEAAKGLLVSGGHFFMVHRPFRLAEILHAMVEAGLEPKRMRLVHPQEDHEPNMVLVEGVRSANAGIIVEKPLVIYEKAGVYTGEVRALYDGIGN